MKSKKTKILILLAAFSSEVYAQDKNAATPQPAASPTAEQVNVDAIKEKYWARGDESEMGVVQNRAYSKTHKLELGVFGGFLTTDPFLNVVNAGGSIGFHFNEYLAFHVMGYKSFVSPSTALLTFQQTLGATTNNNPPNWFLGGEVAGSFLYGKLSLIGKSIIYFDMHLLGGVGATATNSGTYVTPLVGIGEQIYLNHFTSLRIDYRLMRYDETIIEQVITPKLGQPVGTRTNWTNAITMGVDFFVDVFK